MPLINFSLKHPDAIDPFGTSPGQMLHWFGLTDSTFWLEPGNIKLYEYTPDFLARCDNQGLICVDYYLSRFIEDFTELFAQISESLPDEFYAIARSYETLRGFRDVAEKRLDDGNGDDFAAANARFENYDRLTRWLHGRELSAGHLVGGPSVWFFRRGGRLAIVWKADKVTEDNVPIWTAQNGQVEMDFADFIEGVTDFGNRFFSAMDTQIQLAVTKNWGGVQLDKMRLIEEQQERKTQFYQCLNQLKTPTGQPTDWPPIAALMGRNQ